MRTNIMGRLTHTATFLETEKHDLLKKVKLCDEVLEQCFNPSTSRVRQKYLAKLSRVERALTEIQELI